VVKTLLENSETYNINLENYSLLGDSAGGDLTLWVAVELAKLMKSGHNSGINENGFRFNWPRPVMASSLYPCAHNFIYDYFPSLRMDKGVRLLKKNFLTSRSMYLVGLNGHNIQLQRAMKRNWHLADEIRNDAEIMDTVHEKWLPKIYGEIRNPQELDENDFDQVELEYEEIVNLRDTFTDFIRDSVLTKEKVELLRDYGPEKLLIVAGQYDFARDSDVIMARRLKAYGVQTELVVVEKAYHATLVKHLGRI